MNPHWERLVPESGGGGPIAVVGGWRLFLPEDPTRDHQEDAATMTTNKCIGTTLRKGVLNCVSGGGTKAAGLSPPPQKGIVGVKSPRHNPPPLLPPHTGPVHLRGIPGRAKPGLRARHAKRGLNDMGIGTKRLSEPTAVYQGPRPMHVVHHTFGKKKRFWGGETVKRPHTMIKDLPWGASAREQLPNLPPQLSDPKQCIHPSDTASQKLVCSGKLV